MAKVEIEMKPEDWDISAGNPISRMFEKALKRVLKDQVSVDCYGENCTLQYGNDWESKMELDYDDDISAKLRSILSQGNPRNGCKNWVAMVPINHQFTISGIPERMIKTSALKAEELEFPRYVLDAPRSGRKLEGFSNGISSLKQATGLMKLWNSLNPEKEQFQLRKFQTPNALKNNRSVSLDQHEKDIVESMP